MTPEEIKQMSDRLGALEWWVLHASIWIQEKVDAQQATSDDPEGIDEDPAGRDLLAWLDWIITGENNAHTPEQPRR